VTSAHIACLLGLLPTLALASPDYPWAPTGPTEPLAHRFPAPPGFHRVQTDEFGAWLRELPIAPVGEPVRLFDGRLKPRQDVHAAVVAIDVGGRDLQQCADAVMRLRAEYLWSRGRPIEFHPDAGKPRVLRYVPDGDRARFKKFLVRLFAEAGSASLQAELKRASGSVQAGDVLIQGGFPGHAVLVLDVIADDAGHRRLLLAQSYMPAQSIHVLLVEAGRPGDVWYDESALDSPGGLKTPEWWRSFKRADLRRF
jgi:hypothetical protein